MKSRLMLYALVVAAVACHPAVTPIPLTGNPVGVRGLSGQWLGEYTGVESRRRGSIVFTIHLAGDSAIGEVLMEQTGTSGIVHTVDSPAAHALHASGPQFLAVLFVDIAGGQVSGALEPYVAPDCECTVMTTFVGRVTEKHIVGSFTTTGAGLPRQTGQWQVVQTQPPTQQIPNP